MSKILLTSNGFFNDSIKEHFVRLMNKPITSVRVVIITTASTYKQKNKHALKAKSDFHSMGIQEVDFIDVEFDSPNLLRMYNVIYISGGNPYYLLHHMRKSGADETLKEIVSNQELLLVGVSAGAMILGPNIEVANYFTPDINNVNIGNLKALDITSTLIFPHYNREELFLNNSGKSIEDRLKIFESDFQCSIVRLKDDDYVLVQH